MAARRTRQSGSTRLRWTLGILAVLAIWALFTDPDVRVVDEEEALARVIKSEIGTGTPKQKRHVAWSVRNLAREQKQSIAEMVCSPCGPQMRGRPVSSRQRAGKRERHIARTVLSKPIGQDPTGGATHFISPRLQNSLAKSGKRSGYRGNTYRTVRKRWIRSYNWRPYYRIGNNLEFWGPKKPARRKNR